MTEYCPHCDAIVPQCDAIMPQCDAIRPHCDAIMPTVRGGRTTAKTDNALHGQHALTSIASQES